MAPQYTEDISGLVLIGIYCLLVVNGIFLNVFIVIVNLNRWKKSQPLQAIDLIISSLAMVRIVLLFLYIPFIIAVSSGRPIIETEYTLILIMSVEFCSVWWGSVLCVFYCVKITNYNNRLFMRLKMKISKKVPWLLIFSLVASCLCSLPYKWFVISIQSFNGTDGQVIKINCYNSFIIYFAGSIIPFIIFCISVGLLVLSLLRHIRNLGSRGSRFRDAQSDIHLSVIRNMVSFLFFYVLYFLGSNLISMSLKFEKNSLTVLCAIFFTAFPSLHSISIITSNRELKNALLIVIRCSWITNRMPQSA